MDPLTRDYALNSHSIHHSFCAFIFTGGRELLNYYCEQITGDAMLYSMFKIDSEPVKCPPPLKGMFALHLIVVAAGCKETRESNKA
jgi:hypothetical protein